MRFTVPPGVKSIEIKGKTYHAQNGHVEINNPVHIAVASSTDKVDDNAITPTKIGVRSNAAGKTCEKCHFAAWLWQNECPRCHSDLRPQQPTE